MSSEPSAAPASASTTPPRRKLIEVSLPLEAINREAAREKSIRHGHPSTLHLWWARRPLAAARAVLFAQLVDDPSSHPDRFPDEESVQVERKRLHDLIERLVVWENSNDEVLLAEAHAEILASTDGNPPPILDPFCGGGTIPLEAQRLGLEAHGSDLNPVAVLITKALVEIPPKFADQPPVFPGLAESRIGGWKGAEGLAADVRAYGQWMRDEAEKRIGHLYPKATLPDGTEAPVIAWIWARTVICPNPGCGIEMPLVRSWWLGKKKGKEAWISPYLVDDVSAPGGRRVDFAIMHGLDDAPNANEDGTVGRTGATCVGCEAPVPLAHVRGEGRAGRMHATLMAVVAEGARQRIYLAATRAHLRTASAVQRPERVPAGELPRNPRDFKTPNYGMTEWADLFTARQLTGLATFSDLVVEVRDRALADAVGAGIGEGSSLDVGGEGAVAHADAVATYLGLGVSRMVDRSSTIASWDSSASKIRNSFGRQALPMTWDYAEANLFSSSTGGAEGQLQWPAEALERAPARGAAVITQADAASRGLGVLSTDPPYYDNIGYSDLSDFFYVWLRRTLHFVYPRLFGTLLVPKSEELVANAYRHPSAPEAKRFFEQGFFDLFSKARREADCSIPNAVFYAFKQSEREGGGSASTGWETLLTGMLTNWMVTGTWPMRSELGHRMIASGANALASSVVLALRPRPADAPSTDRRGFITALRHELPDAIRELQQGRIAPVDLPQAAIGPGMAIFSRYAQVVEADGSPMKVRAALAHINEALGEIQAEHEGDFDPTTRFAIAWFRQHGYASGPFGSADDLARARATAVDAIARTGILTSGGGKVTLIRPAELPNDYRPDRDERISVWEVLHHTVRMLDNEGIGAAGRLLAQVEQRSDAAVDLDLGKELAFLLFAVCEDKGWSKEAIAFNSVATTWPDLVEASRAHPPASAAAQGELDLSATDDDEERS